MAIRVLVNRNFGLVWTGKTVSQLGDKLYGIALAWWVLEKTGSLALMGLLMCASVLPGLICGLLAGPLVDRWNRKATLVVADLIRGLTIGLIALLQLSGRLELSGLFAAAILLSLASALFDPAAQAAVPQLVPPDKLARANSLNQLANGLTAVSGPIIGAMGVSLVGYAWIFGLNALSFFLSAGLVAIVHFGQHQPAKYRKAYWRELQEGFYQLRRQPSIRRIIIVVAVTHFFVAALMISLPALARGIGAAGGSGIQILGLLEAAIGLGLIAGAALFGWRRKAHNGERGLYRRVLGFGLVFTGLGLASRLWPQNPLAPLALILVYGGLVAQAGVLWSSILQEQVPREMAGRIFSLSNVSGNSAMPLAFAITGLLLERLPLSVCLLLSGGLLGSFALMLLVQLRNHPGPSAVAVPGRPETQQASDVPETGAAG